MNDLCNVAVFFGGQSFEHDVSKRSAEVVLHAIDRDVYSPIPILVDREGKWSCNGERLSLIPGERAVFGSKRVDVDVAFPLIHGKHGEDGTLQGLLKMVGIPFVGSGVLGSAIGLDKEVTKRLLQQAGIPVAPFVSFRNRSMRWREVTEHLRPPLFVKPVNAGSSFGIAKVSNEAEYEASLTDEKMIIESALEGREIECGVFRGKALPLCEIIPHGEFYSFDLKWNDGADIIVPAEIDGDEIRELAVKIFHLLECDGFARVDFFVTHDGQIYCNEINTVPGLTLLSGFPRMCEAAGISMTTFIDQLLQEKLCIAQA